MLDQFNELGARLYGDKWPIVKRHQIDRITGGATEDETKLMSNQLQRLINGMKSIEFKITRKVK